MKLKLFITTFFLAVVIFMATTSAKAQNPAERVIKYAPDTATSADTVIITFTGIGSHLKSMSTVVTKVTGTIAGIVLLQGSNDDVTWYDVNTDTLTCTNQTTNKKHWAITATNYYSYRVWYKQTTGTAAIRLTYLRRPDEN